MEVGVFVGNQKIAKGKGENRKIASTNAALAAIHLYLHNSHHLIDVNNTTASSIDKKASTEQQLSAVTNWQAKNAKQKDKRK